MCKKSDKISVWTTSSIAAADQGGVESRTNVSNASGTPTARTASTAPSARRASACPNFSRVPPASPTPGASPEPATTTYVSRRQ